MFALSSDVLTACESVVLVLLNDINFQLHLIAVHEIQGAELDPDPRGGDG